MKAADSSNLAQNVDRLESEGKITSELAARIRKKPTRLIGWGMIFVGVAFVAKLFLGI